MSSNTGAGNSAKSTGMAEKKLQNEINTFSQNLQNFRNLCDRYKPKEGPISQADLLRFHPHLLIRSTVEDNGTRPLQDTCKSQSPASPDIWFYQSDPATAPDIPPSSSYLMALPPQSASKNYLLMQQKYSLVNPWHDMMTLPYTVYAHIWNLGRAPIVGARVEFYFSHGSYDDKNKRFTLNPPFDDKNSELIGVARADLSSIENSTGCHKLVKCPVPLLPALTSYLAKNNMAKKYGINDDMNIQNVGVVVVRISGIGDPIGPNGWDPCQNRHVAALFYRIGPWM